MLKFNIVHRAFTSPGYGKRPPIALTAPDTHMTSALTALKYLPDLKALTDQPALCTKLSEKGESCGAVSRKLPELQFSQNWKSVIYELTISQYSIDSIG